MGMALSWGFKSRKKVSVFSFAWLLVILFVALLCTAQALLLFSDILPGVATQEIKDSRFISNTENITFTLPEGWRRLDDAPEYFPKGSDGKVLYSLGKEGTSCTIVYASMSERAGFDQVSFGNRVFSRDWQFDSNWFLPFEEGRDVAFSGSERQYLRSEFRFTSLNRRDNRAFILLNQNQDPVSDVCNDEMNRLLETVEYYYEDIALDNESEGLLWTIKEFSNSKDRERIMVLFTPQGSSENYRVGTLPDASNDEFIAANNKLYYLSYSDDPTQYRSNFSFFNPLAGTSGVVDGTDFINSYVSSLYVQGGNTYYLVVPADNPDTLDCVLLDLSKCMGDKSLYRVDFSEGSKPILVAENIHAERILGYDSEENAFYLSAGYGDAGCAVVNYWKHHDNKEDFLGHYSACADLETAEVTVEEGAEVALIIEEIQKKIGSPQIIKTIGIASGGILSPVIEERKESSWNRIFFEN